MRDLTEGRTHFDTRKTAGKTPMEAMPSLKRRLSNVVFAQMVADQKRREAADPGGHSGTTAQSCVTDRTPDIGSSDKPSDEAVAKLRRRLAAGEIDEDEYLRRHSALE